MRNRAFVFTVYHCVILLGSIYRRNHSIYVAHNLFAQLINSHQHTALQFSSAFALLSASLRDIAVLLLSASRLVPHHLLLLLRISESSNDSVVTTNISTNDITRRLLDDDRFAVDVHLVAIGGMENVELHGDDVRYRGLLVLQKLLLVVPTYLVIAVYVDQVVVIDTGQQIDLVQFTLRS